MSVNPGFKQAVINGTVSTAITIKWFDSGGHPTTITSESIVSESLALLSAICDGTELKFGGCIASTLELDISSQHDLTDRYITVSCTQTASMPLYPGANVFPGANIFPGGATYTESFDIFSGVVFSCKLAKNKLTRHLVAYDYFYSKGMKNCIGVYKNLFSGGGTVTLGDLRAAIISAYSFTEARSVTLPADSFAIHKMDDLTELTVSDALRMIGEFNGVFLRLNGHGDIEYVSIGGEDDTAEEYTFYIDAEAEDFSVSEFDSIYTNIGTYILYADSPHENPYPLDNPLVLAGYVSPGETGDHFSDAWSDVRNGIYTNFHMLPFTPAMLRAETRLWVQPGDRVQFTLIWYAPDNLGSIVRRTRTISTIMLSRRIKGIQAMIDEIRALQN